jgi:uncharacterized protein
MQLQKSGIRVLGIAESCSSREKSHLCGVVMRRDLHVDGFVFGTVTVGGDDATREILRMIRELNRQDLNLIMLSGCVIAWYNIINPSEIHIATKIPVICVSYEESEGLEDHILLHFPGDIDRVARYQNLGDRTEVSLPTGYSLFARGWGVTEKEMARACRLFTHHGKIPEPVRVARIAARSMTDYIRHETDAVR